MDSLDVLSCKIECQELIMRHGAAMDQAAPAEGMKLFTEDARIGAGKNQDPGMPLSEYWDRKPEAFLFFRPRYITNVVITPTGTDTAEGVAYVTMTQVPKLYWHYRFRKTDEGWRICRRWEEKIIEDEDVPQPHVPGTTA